MDLVLEESSDWHSDSECQQRSSYKGSASDSIDSIILFYFTLCQTIQIYNLCSINILQCQGCFYDNNGAELFTVI